MSEIKIDLNDMVDVLSMQVANLSKENAYNVAVIKAKDAELQSIREELDRLRKEHIDKMDE